MRRFKPSRGVLKFGQFVDRRNGGEAIKAAHREFKSPFTPIVVVIQKTECLFDSVTHSLGSSSADPEKVRHLVERQALAIQGQSPGEFENGDRFLQPRGAAPAISTSNIDVSVSY